MDDSETFCLSANVVSKTFREDCSVAEEPQIQHDKRSEEDANSNSTLRYISQMLLEEDTNEKVRTSEEELALLATERAFHDILRQEYYSIPDEPLLPDVVYQRSSVDGTNYKKSYDGGRRKLITNGPVDDTHSIRLPLESADPTLALSTESLTARQIQKGYDEAKKFLPNIGEFFINLGSNRSNSGRNWQSRTKRSPNYSDLDQLVGRLPKQIFVYTDEPIRNENFDKVLLLKGQKFEEDSMLRKIMQKKMTNHSRRIQTKVSNNKMKRDKNWRMLESVDVRSLLITCSKAISVNNHPLAKELICEIKKYSSPHGDWSQRLAYYFVDGLEARLTGTSSEIYHKLVAQNLTVIEWLKVYRMYRVASPCRGILIYFLNQTILNNISKQTQKVHIINYGILQGFQWPAFFEHFANWEGFPPKIRITIIEFPEPGLCPRRKVELIRRLVADYAKIFNVPFEYEAIVLSEWQNVEVEDLKIAKDEVVIVNCLAHSEKLSDEVVHTNSPRDIFLNNIRMIKPHIFIHIVFNGPNNSPYFPHRFRDALSLYSSFFEMLDSNLPRGNLERLIIEKHFLMPEAINAIAFEGPNRVARPETYKQWHARKLRAGLVPLPVDPRIKKDVINFVQEHYHKEFVVEDDNGWLLLGWKGRILYGFTTWKASEV
ncbi:hypothetical protein LUZ61_020622 [Rhynchospora tenuis]|uniref:Scarecrow-like protein 14 n=1 Tax=Rhynchospora tenuis TaxID=198213 RepID=A0AAD6EP06_9POAL|nr:hypothetical protein LUZ61_020622 [Rhynchospora tenuis]